MRESAARSDSGEGRIASAETEWQEQSRVQQRGEERRGEERAEVTSASAGLVCPFVTSDASANTARKPAHQALCSFPASGSKVESHSPPPGACPAQSRPSRILTASLLVCDPSRSGAKSPRLDTSSVRLDIRFRRHTTA